MESRPSRIVVCPGHSMQVNEVAFSNRTRDGCLFLSAGHDRKAILRDADTGDWIGTLSGHRGAVWTVDLNSNCTLGATGSADFTYRVWDMTDGRELCCFDTETSVVKTVKFDKTSERLACGGNDKRIRLHDLNRPDAKPSFTRATGGDYIRRLNFVDENTMVSISYSSLDSASKERCVRFWDLRTMQPEFRVDLPGVGCDLDLQGQKMVITTQEDPHVIIMDLQDLSRPLLLHDHDLTSIKKDFMPETGTVAFNFEHKNGSRGLILTGEKGNYHGPKRQGKIPETNWIRACDLQTGKEIFFLTGHHGPIFNVRIHPDWRNADPGNLRIASVADDATVRIWDCL